MTEDKKQADMTRDEISHLIFEAQDRIPAEIFEAIEALNITGTTKTGVMIRQRQVIEMFLDQIDPNTPTTPRWTIYDGLAVQAWKAKELPPKPKRGRPGVSEEAVVLRALSKLFTKQDYKDLRRANPSTKAEEALSCIAERFGMDVERVNNIIRLSTKDIALPPKTSDEPDIVAMWFEWLARRRMNFPDK